MDDLPSFSTFRFDEVIYPLDYETEGHIVDELSRLSPSVYPEMILITFDLVS